MKSFNLIFAFLICMFLSSPVFGGDLSIPNQFQSGTSAVASEVNANFDAVETAVNDNDTRLTNVEASKQNRVSGTCPVGSSIRVINANGTVACEEDTSGPGTVGISSVTAGSGLTGGGTSGGVTLNVGAGTGITVNTDNVSLNTTYGDGRYVNEGQANSITAGMAAFNYAGSTSEGGAASNLACTDCVSKSELNFEPGDITGVTAGSNLSGGGSSGSVTISAPGMPGVDWYQSGSGGTISTSFTSSNKATVTITAPTSGYVILTGSGSIVWDNSSTAYGLIRIKVSNTINDISENAGIQFIRQYFYGTSTAYMIPFSVSNVIFVSAGSNNFYLNIWHQVVNGTARLDDFTLIAQFVPRRY